VQLAELQTPDIVMPAPTLPLVDTKHEEDLVVQEVQDDTSEPAVELEGTSMDMNAEVQDMPEDAPEESQGEVETSQEVAQEALLEIHKELHEAPVKSSETQKES
jgi:hypothetical protein